MRAGALDRRAQLQRPTLAQDSFGQPVETWTDVATVWAQKVPVRGAERFTDAQLDAQLEATFRIRHRSDVAPLWRLTCEGTAYDVTAVLELGRREGLELLTKLHRP